MWNIISVSALCVVVLVTVAAVWKREELHRLMAVQSVFSEDKIAANLSNMGSAFLAFPVSRGDGPASDLHYSTLRILRANLGNFIGDRRVTALLVMKGEQIVPADWIATSTALTANTASGETG